MHAGTASLLRPFSSASCRLVLLAAVSLALAAPAAAGSAAPDPSPSTGSSHPDPYLLPVRPRAPARTPAPPTSVVRTPVHTAPSVRRNPRAPVTPTTTVVRTRPSTKLEPGIAARVARVVEPTQRVSRTLALTVAGLVLLSGALVAGAAREVAR